jgi:hypothetical protein
MKGIHVTTEHRFAGHADAPTTWCVVPDSRTEHGYCGRPKDAAIHIRPDPAVIGGAALGESLFGPPKETANPNNELAEELRKAIFDVELMIETNRVTDGPRNQKERAEQAEQHALVNRLAKIRRALYRAKDVIDNLEA